MHAATDRLEFAPPPTAGLTRALGLAVLAHAVLLAALTWGVHWKRDAVTVTAEAELWSSVPQQAAPKLVEIAPEPPETPKPTPKPTPPPPQAQPKLPDADIALEREKLRLKKEKQQELEKLKQDKLSQEKLLLEKKRQQDKRDQDRQAIEDKKKSDLDSKRKEAAKAQQDAKQMEAQRQANIQRMAGLAGATGASTATGTARQSSGPSASYAGRIRASIKPNIVFADDTAGNPVAEVEVRTAPDGTIISRKLTKPSGVNSWDDAVLKAIDKTGKLPRDVDGRVPNALIISFRPRD
ncbi:MAG: cell envelope integrity protein TolA [Rhodoferax sp.]|uniref:cell envelope integrity protein TolA n=1 Tax=Rhodoferax sp. TaxID=50421 RepID=UPI0027292BE2|nr:cell envelope integrity protein TolA [Rhodoferax sp.]MDO8449047.1 cell envelope integrity protein TolA [Rhodoferax sp.]